MYWNKSIERIHVYNPKIKLIIILRNPIDRAYSSWQMVKNNEWTNFSFKEAIDEELKYRLDENKTFNTAVFHYLQRGLYYQQIKEFLKWFPRQNLLVFILEHFDEDMNKEYNKIYKFWPSGSDERQYNSPGFNLNMCGLSRTIYGGYKEYHTSLDNLQVISKKGLRGGYKVSKQAIKNLLNFENLEILKNV